MAFRFANLSPLWLSTFGPAVWCELVTVFVFFCPRDVEPVRFLDLLTGCFSSLEMLAEDLCCLLVLSSAARCKLKRHSPLFRSTEDSAGLRSCAQISVSANFANSDELNCPVVCNEDFWNTMSGKLYFKCVDHAY